MFFSEVQRRSDACKGTSDCGRKSVSSCQRRSLEQVSITVDICCLEILSYYVAQTPFNTLVVHCMLHGGSAVGRWTCDLQVAGSIPSWSAFT